MSKKIKKLGEMLYKSRKSRGLTQVDVAKRLKISQPHISKIENGVAGMTLEDGVKVLTFIGQSDYPDCTPPQQAMWTLSEWLS